MTAATQAADDLHATQRAAQARRKALAPWLLMLPALVIVLVFFGIPTLYMVRMSFNLHIDQRLYVPGFTFEHYVNLFSNPLFTNAILTTIRLALIASLAFEDGVLDALLQTGWRDVGAVRNGSADD